MFPPGFETVDIDIDADVDTDGDAGVRIHGVVGGSGPPVLLLHGYPQSHVMWQSVAAELVRDHTVVVTDLRGYGDSSAPAPGADSAGYAKRAMAADQVEVMRRLGFERFAAVGHDRGARVVHRMCLDHPHAVSRAAVLDIVPTSYLYEHVDRALAEAYYHWFFLSRPADLPESLIAGDPGAYLRRCLSSWSADGFTFGEQAVAEYVRCFDASTISASCHDYRAGAGVDLEHAAADGTDRVTCPLLVLWGGRGFVGRHYDVLDVWRGFADDVRGEALDCGHFLPEEQPAATVAALRAFLS